MIKKIFHSILNAIIRIPFVLRYYRIKDTSSSVYHYQKEFLLDSVQISRSCEYGKKYGFDSIKTIEDYIHKVPLCDYEHIQPYIEQSMKGESNIITSYYIPWFTKSAGTTGSHAKYIPVTYESLKENHFQCSKDFLTLYIKNNPNSKLFEGKGIALAGGFGKNDYTGDKNIGYISSILSTERPKRFSYFMALGNDFLTLDNRESKLQYINKHHTSSQITSISGVGPRIVQLGKYLETTCRKKVSEIWPNLEVILSGGVSIEPYVDQYKKIFGDDILIYNMYNGSEGFYGFQTSNTSHELLLATHHAIFYEFIPMESFAGIESSGIVDISQVEVGVEYALVITTNSGLRRYIVGDTVRFSSLNPYYFTVTGRTKYYINLFGEQVYTHHITQALVDACKKTQAIVLEYTVGPQKISETHGNHQRVIEFEKPPKDIERFGRLLDESMKEHAYHYGTKRKGNVLLHHPTITTVASGTFEKWMASKGKAGGQFKIPNVWNTREYVDDILEYSS